MCKGSPIDKLNILFEKSTLLGQPDINYVSLMLKVAYKDGCALLREQMRKQNLKLFTATANSLIAEGIRAGLFHTKYPETIGPLILLLEQELVDEIGCILTGVDENPDLMLKVLDYMDVYRNAVELMLNAPYGSMVIFDADQILTLAKSLARYAQIRRRSEARR